MSELQAILQARRRRADGSFEDGVGGNDDDDDGGAPMVGVGGAGAGGWTAPGSPPRAEECATTEDGIEVSPNAGGREALRLFEQAGGGGGGGSSAGPPPMPSYGGGVSRNSLPYEGGSKQAKFDRQYDAIMGGQNQHREQRHSYSYAGSQQNQPRNHQQQRRSYGGVVSQDFKGGGGGGVNTNALLGTVSPENSNSTPGEEGEGEEENRAPSPKNELEKKLRDRRRKFVGGNDDNVRPPPSPSLRSPKSPRVEMRWNAATMSYEAHTVAEGVEDEEEDEDNNEKDSSDQSTSDVAEEEDVDKKVEAKGGVSYRNKLSTPSGSATPGSNATPRSASSPRSPSRPIAFFKRTAPSANSGTVVIGSQQNWRSPQHYQQQQQQAMNAHQSFGGEGMASSSQNQPLPSKKQGGRSSVLSPSRDDDERSVASQSSRRSIARQYSTLLQTSKPGEDDGSSVVSQTGQPDQLRPSRSTASTAPIANTSPRREQQQQQQSGGGGRSIQIGGRPQAQTEFSRTVAGRSASRGRGRMENDDGPEGRPSVLSMMAKKYKEGREQHDRQLLEQEDEDEGGDVIGARSTTMSKITKFYKERREAMDEEEEVDIGLKQEQEQQQEQQEEENLQQRPQSYHRPAMSSPSRSSNSSGALNRWLQTSHRSGDTDGKSPITATLSRGSPDTPSRGINVSGGGSSLNRWLQSSASRGVGGSVGTPQTPLSGTGTSLPSPRLQGGGTPTARGLPSGRGVAAAVPPSPGVSLAAPSNVSTAWGSRTGSGSMSNFGSASPSEESVPEFLRTKLKPTAVNKRSIDGRGVAPKREEGEGEEGDVDTRVAVGDDEMQVQLYQDAEEVAWPEMTPPQSLEEDDVDAAQPHQPSPPETSVQSMAGHGQGKNVRGRWQPRQPPTVTRTSSRDSSTHGSSYPFVARTTSRDSSAPSSFSPPKEKDPSLHQQLPTMSQQLGNVRARWQPPQSPSKRQAKVPPAATAAAAPYRAAFPTVTSFDKEENEDSHTHQQKGMAKHSGTTKQPGSVRGRWQPPSPYASTPRGGGGGGGTKSDIFRKLPGAAAALDATGETGSASARSAGDEDDAPPPQGEGEDEEDSPSFKNARQRWQQQPIASNPLSSSNRSGRVTDRWSSRGALVTSDGNAEGDDDREGPSGTVPPSAKGSVSTPGAISGQYSFGSSKGNDDSDGKRMSNQFSFGSSGGDSGRYGGAHGAIRGDAQGGGIAPGGIFRTFTPGAPRGSFPEEIRDQRSFGSGAYYGSSPLSMDGAADVSGDAMKNVNGDGGSDTGGRREDWGDVPPDTPGRISNRYPFGQQQQQQQRRQKQQQQRQDVFLSTSPKVAGNRFHVAAARAQQQQQQKQQQEQLRRKQRQWEEKANGGKEEMDMRGAGGITSASGIEEAEGRIERGRSYRLSGSSRLVSVAPLDPPSASGRLDVDEMAEGNRSEGYLPHGYGGKEEGNEDALSGRQYREEDGEEVGNAHDHGEMHQHRPQEVEESPFLDETPEEGGPYISNYDTAVMAARDAIDMSNRSRSRKAGSRFQQDTPPHLSSPYASSPVASTQSPAGMHECPPPGGDDDSDGKRADRMEPPGKMARHPSLERVRGVSLEMVRDPSLRMEPSPDPSPTSSVAEEQMAAEKGQAAMADANDGFDVFGGFEVRGKEPEEKESFRGGDGGIGPVEDSGGGGVPHVAIPNSKTDIFQAAFHELGNYDTGVVDSGSFDEGDHTSSEKPTAQSNLTGDCFPTDFRVESDYKTRASGNDEKDAGENSAATLHTAPHQDAPVGDFFGTSFGGSSDHGGEAINKNGHEDDEYSSNRNVSRVAAGERHTPKDNFFHSDAFQGADGFGAHVVSGVNDSTDAHIASNSEERGAPVEDFFNPPFTNPGGDAPEDDTARGEQSPYLAAATENKAIEGPEGGHGFDGSLNYSGCEVPDAAGPFGSDPFDTFNTEVFSYQNHDALATGTSGAVAPDGVASPSEGEGRNDNSINGEGQGNESSYSADETTGGESPLFEATFGEVTPKPPIVPPPVLHEGGVMEGEETETSDVASGAGRDIEGRMVTPLANPDKDESESSAKGISDIGGLLLAPLANPDTGDSDKMDEPIADLSGISRSSSYVEGNDSHNEDISKFAMNASNFADQNGDDGKAKSVDVDPNVDGRNVVPQGQLTTRPRGEDCRDYGSFRVRYPGPSLCAPGEARRIPQPVQNPLSGNLILCRCHPVDGAFAIEEWKSCPATMLRTSVVSVRVQMSELEAKLSASSLPAFSNNTSDGSFIGVKILGMASVLSLAAGVHRVKGRARIRVAMLAELFVAADGTVQGTGRTARVRVVAVWRWGYSPSGGAKLAMLQSVLPTPRRLDNSESGGLGEGVLAGGNGGGYDPQTLQVADGLVFLAGHVSGHNADSDLPSSSPAVFVFKPAAALTGWSFVAIKNTDADSVVALAISNRNDYLMAVGLSDGSVKVLSYELAARTNRMAATSQQKRGSISSSLPMLLRTVCRMSGETDLAGLEYRDCLWPYEQYPAAVQGERKGRHCRRASLAWIHKDRCTSGVSDLPLLACAFSAGVVVYKVSVSLEEKRASGSADVAEDPQVQMRLPRAVAPLAMARFFPSETMARVPSQLPSPSAPLAGALGIEWFDAGPRRPPCLIILAAQRLFLCAIDIPWYGSVDVMGGSTDELDGQRRIAHRPLGVICQMEMDFGGKSVQGSACILVDSSLVGSVATCYLGGILSTYEPTVTSESAVVGVHVSDSAADGHLVDRFFSSLYRPVSSLPLGLDSDGRIIHHAKQCPSDEEDYRDAVLSVFSVTSCSGDSDGRDESLRNGVRSMPSQRHWLLILTPGDAAEHNNRRNGDAMDGCDQAALGGATAKVLFELTCGESPTSGLIPERVVREPGRGRRAAVMFSSGFFCGNANAETDDSRTHAKISPDSVAYAVLDMASGMKEGTSSSFRLYHGRDVAFLPPALSESGFYCSTLVVLDADGRSLSVTTAITASALPEGENERVVESIQRCSLRYEGVIGHRVFALIGRTRPEIMIAGYSEVVKRPCLLLSSHRLESDGMSGENHLTLVEDTRLGHRLWLRPGEEIIALVELPPRQKIDSGEEEMQMPIMVAVASQIRVMIISVKTCSSDNDYHADDGCISIVAELDAPLTCANLVPLGSHCVAFCSALASGESSLMYLSCLENGGSDCTYHGIIIAAISASPPLPGGETLLAAIRPDRVIYMSSHSGLQIFGDDEEDEKRGGHALDHMFIVPVPTTRPVLLLEPMVINALCSNNGVTSREVQRQVRTVIEKFGRKDIAFPHPEDMGIGTFGAGITQRVFDVLIQQGCREAAAFLLTGTLPGDINPGPKPGILPLWMPLHSKLMAAPTVGDRSYPLEYIQETLSIGGECNLPDMHDPMSILAEESAYCALLREGSSLDASMLLDLAGQPYSKDLLGQLALLYRQGKESDELPQEGMLVKNMMAQAAQIDTGVMNEISTLCYSGVGTRLFQNGSEDRNRQEFPLPVQQLAPSVQFFGLEGEGLRVRSGMFCKNFSEAVASSPFNNDDVDAAWRQSVDKVFDVHVWKAGPFGRKENLLELDTFEPWVIGMCRPSVLGSEGVALAADTGEGALADILNAAAAATEGEGVDGSRGVYDGGKDPVLDNENDRHRNWIKGIGESRLDEDNLSLYLRFSEGVHGDEEDRGWADEGFADLTKNAHVARLCGDPVLVSVEATSNSSLDEGEEGKVHLLHDLVYRNGAPRDQPSGLVVEASRGSSLDIGMLHDTRHALSRGRGRCTVEMWYHVPCASDMVDEIILVRRSLFYEENNDATKLCLPDEKHNTLWELAVLTTGVLELRTSAGSVVTSTKSFEGDDDDQSDSSNRLVSWTREDGSGGGWNHVCLLFSQLASQEQQISPLQLSASILMNGNLVVSNAPLVVNPFGPEPEVQNLNQDDIEDAMERTVLIFGIGPPSGFRMTDIRVWACLRSEEDVRMMMHESLRDAEMKRRLKVNIRNKVRGKAKDKPLGGRGNDALVLPPPGSKKVFALSPPPRQSPAAKRAAANAHSNDVDGSSDSKDVDFVPSFAVFAKGVAQEEVNALEIVVPNLDKEEPDPLITHTVTGASLAFAKFEDTNVVEEVSALSSKKVGGTVTSDAQSKHLWGNLADDADKNIPGIAKVGQESALPREKANMVDDVDGPKNTIDPPEEQDVIASEDVVAEVLSNGGRDKDCDPHNISDRADALMKREDELISSSSEGHDFDEGECREKEEEKETASLAKSSFDVTFSDLLSKYVRKSAAAAIVRGPPAARHFGGNRGGLPPGHIDFGGKRDGVGPTAICGVDKSVVWFSDRDPPGRTYPIGASGAILSDVMDEDGSEYMCCFLAKEKRMVVFELTRKTVVVELQMKTKLNFWRYLPPEAHGGELAFVLITPVGGFHWRPLDESPRPCQVWRRGPELESKKILTYEEGGSNGNTGANARSTVALVIATSTTPRSTTEAYCIAMDGGSAMLCISNGLLGAALYRPSSSNTSPSYFLPFMVTISRDVTSQLVLDVEDLVADEESGALVRGGIIASTDLGADNDDSADSFMPPSMSMGPTPEALCCCHNGFITAVIRRRGLVFAFDFSGGDLVLVGKSGLGQYVVDAAIRSSDAEGEVELVLLLCEGDDQKDGRVATVNISRSKGIGSQYLSSI